MRSAVLKDITRLVVKLGTGVLTDSRKQPDLAQMEQLVTQVAAQRRAGREVVLVTSGAVGAGMGVLGFEARPKELAELQACAAVGQSRLMTTYENLFSSSASTSRKSSSRTTISNTMSATLTPATRSSPCSTAASSPSSTRTTPSPSPS